MKKIFLDLDGVIFNWNDAARKLIGNKMEEQDLYILYKQKNKLIKKLVKKQGVDFWINLELLPWALELIDVCSSYSEYSNLAFLTSYGSFFDAPKGKLISLQRKKLNHIPLIFTRSKWILANNDSLLIDDSENHLQKFSNAGGFVFKWPHNGKPNWKSTINSKSVINKLKKDLEYFIYY